jgi:hypothetical protein
VKCNDHKIIQLDHAKEKLRGPKSDGSKGENPQHLAIFPHEKNYSQVSNLIQWWGFARMVTRIDLRLRSLVTSDLDKGTTYLRKDRR